MGIGLRIFTVEDDDKIERLAQARFDRLIERDPEEYLPQYASRRIRYATAYIEFVNRKPVEIVTIQVKRYTYLKHGLR